MKTINSVKVSEKTFFGVCIIGEEIKSLKIAKKIAEFHGDYIVFSAADIYEDEFNVTFLGLKESTKAIIVNEFNKPFSVDTLCYHLDKGFGIGRDHIHPKIIICTTLPDLLKGGSVLARFQRIDLNSEPTISPNCFIDDRTTELKEAGTRSGKGNIALGIEKFMSKYNP